MNIDRALIELCRKHDLSALSCGVSMCFVAAGNPFTAYAHWGPDEARQCEQGHGVTFSDAVAEAIQRVNKTRACLVDVPAIEMGVAA